LVILSALSPALKMVEGFLKNLFLPLRMPKGVEDSASAKAEKESGKLAARTHDEINLGSCHEVRLDMFREFNVFFAVASVGVCAHGDDHVVLHCLRSLQRCIARSWCDLVRRKSSVFLAS
jgi:hypothetical protein